MTNKTLAYYMGRTFLYCQKIGINMSKFRFRQHRSDEMAHYAKDCWDAEILMSYGWTECVGHADRECYDLRQHELATEVRLQAEHVYKEPKIEKTIEIKVNRKAIGLKYKKEAHTLIEYLNQLTIQNAENLKKEINKKQKVSVELTIIPQEKKEDQDKKSSKAPPIIEEQKLEKKEFEITDEMLEIKEKETKIFVKSYWPPVIEPSFGIGRILYALLEHNIWYRENDENRIVLSLKPRIAPVKVSIFPLSNKNELMLQAKQIHKILKQHNILSRIDNSGANIGKKYARSDEMGTPFNVTVDFETKNDRKVTIRERDSTKQIRVLIHDAPILLRDLSLETITWDQAFNQYNQ